MTKCEVCEGRSAEYECFGCETKVCENCVVNCSKFGNDFCCEECLDCPVCDYQDKCIYYLELRIDNLKSRMKHGTKSKKVTELIKTLEGLREDELQRS